MADEAEIDSLLQRDPRNIDALAAKGDARAAAGDDRGAMAFYKAALEAAAAAQPLPPSLRPAIEKAQAGVARANRLFEAHLEQSLAEKGFADGQRPERFQQSIELLLGRKQASLGLQRPTSYFFPRLEQKPYFEREELPWAAEIEGATGLIREELLAFLSSGGADAFSPYIVSDPSRPPREVHALTDNPDWSTLDLWKDGHAVPGLADHFPGTLAAVGKLDIPRIGARAPSILFSRLAPGARIPPHHGVMNARLICHLPLIVPAGCSFRVGDEVREWREGELLVFDDTVEHEAWNRGSGDRIVLIFDVWRPELSAEERGAITAMFEVVDSYDA